MCIFKSSIRRISDNGIYINTINNHYLRKYCRAIIGVWFRINNKKSNKQKYRRPMAFEYFKMGLPLLKSIQEDNYRGGICSPLVIGPGHINIQICDSTDLKPEVLIPCEGYRLWKHDRKYSVCYDFP